MVVMEEIPEIIDCELEDLLSIRTIGTGTFGRVKLVQHCKSGGIFALKCMNKSEIVTLHQERNTLAEKNLLYDCAGCRFILRLIRTFNLPNQVFMYIYVYLYVYLYVY
jgi:protein kinase A